MSPRRTFVAARPRPLPWILAAFATLLFLISASALRAQAGNYQVLVDSVSVGSATAVANLPVPGVPSTTPTETTVPPKQAHAATQTSIALTSSDLGLVTVMRGWMAANNSGTKNTVQPKTVEVDQIVPTGGPIRYVLHDAWPSHIDSASGSTTITIVYGRAEVLHQ